MRQSQAEIQQLHIAVLAHHHVAWFQIAVNDAGAVRCRERVGDLHGDAQYTSLVRIPCDGINW